MNQNWPAVRGDEYAGTYRGQPIHPFLDGNGHVQRALFASLALEFGYRTNDSLTIHPRPYDRLFAIALELFARSPEASASQELGIVRVYLNSTFHERARKWARSFVVDKPLSQDRD
jgi:hypothetical protein